MLEVGGLRLDAEGEDKELSVLPQTYNLQPITRNAQHRMN
jgi:ribosomal protein L25 (general stress protein Ctc)